MRKMDAIQIKEMDNVATALRDLEPKERAVVGIGERFQECIIAQPIPYGHKFALKEIGAGEDIVKYGEIMGRATQGIPVGSHAHIHNIESLRGRGDLESGR